MKSTLVSERGFKENKPDNVKQRHSFLATPLPYIKLRYRIYLIAPLILELFRSL